MDGLGRHLLVELHDCDPVALDDLEGVSALLRDVSEEAGLTVIETRVHRFSPHGLSGVAVLSESHLAIHTWPEHAYAAVDIFTCGEHPALDRGVALLVGGLGCARHSTILIGRGGSEPTLLAGRLNPA